MPGHVGMDAENPFDRPAARTRVAALVELPPSVSEWKSAGRIPDDKRSDWLRRPPWSCCVGTCARDDWHGIWPELVGMDGAAKVPEAEAREA